MIKLGRNIWNRVIAAILSIILGVSPIAAGAEGIRGDVDFSGSIISDKASGIYSPTAASFIASLQTGLVPERSYGSSIPTFARATAAHQTDFEGKLNLVPSGAARIQGARYVRNLITTQDLSNAYWAKAGTATITGTTQINLPAVNDGVTSAILGTVSSSAFVWRARLSGSGTVSVILTNNNGTEVTLTVTLTAGGTTLSNIFTPVAIASAYTLKFVRLVGNTATAVTVTEIQVENSTGQTNQNPSEYVSVGVLSAPYHGAGVDGVKYFSTLNGNTVASNVVTEATGAAITSAAAAAAGGVTAGVVDATGPTGYLAEGVRVNLALQSQTLQNWSVPTNATPLDNQYVAPNGTTTVAKLTANAGNAVHGIYNGITTPAGAHTQSAYIKYVNNRWAVIYIYDGTNTLCASFDLLNGLAGAKTAGVTSTISPTALTGVYRVTATATTLASASGRNGIFMNATDTASLETWNAAGTEIVGIWGEQAEDASFASSYIPTTTVAVQRNADVLTYASAGNMAASSSPETWYFEIAQATRIAGGLITTGVSYRSTAVDGGPYKVYGYHSASNTGTDTYTVTEIAAGTVSKIAYVYDGTNLTMYTAGTSGVAKAQGAHPTEPTTITFGSSYVMYRNVRIYPKALPASKLQSMTQ